MYQQERMDEIIRILKKNHYVTVEYLVKEIRYSPASIRRDLTLLEKQGLVTRSYGGVSIKDSSESPFRFRQHSMKAAKNAIAKKAASLVNNGDVVFMDYSSTTQYMGHFLTEKKGITVVTSNMLLANFLSEHGIEAYCTGGKVVDYPGILGGQIMRDTFKRFNADIAFCSSTALSSDGRVLVRSENGVSNLRVLRENSNKLVYLCGSDKYNARANYVCFTLDEIDYFVSNEKPSAKLINRYADTAFICTK